MPSYIGFSTINANKPKTTNALPGEDGGPGNILRGIVFGKKFRMVDTPLVLQDFINALNIRQGEKVGQPEYGTTLWSYVFEPNTTDMQFQLENELRRVASQDPRLELNQVRAFPQENGILVELELSVYPFNQAQIVSIYFDGTSSRALIQ
jgi:phage baseplate assembly protein W